MDSIGIYDTIPERPNCPQATHELLLVEPVTLPTNQLAQAITVQVGNYEVMTVTTELGTFSGICGPHGRLLAAGGWDSPIRLLGIP